MADIMGKAFFFSLLVNKVIALPVIASSRVDILPEFTVTTSVISARIVPTLESQLFSDATAATWPGKSVTIPRAPTLSVETKVPSFHALTSHSTAIDLLATRTVSLNSRDSLGYIDTAKPFLQNEAHNIFSLLSNFTALPQELHDNTRTLYAILLEDYLTTVRAHTSPWLNQKKWRFGAPLEKPNTVLIDQGAMLGRLGRVLQNKGDALPAAEMELNWMACHIMRSNEQISSRYYVDLFEAGLDFKKLNASVCLFNTMAVVGAFHGTPQWKDWANVDQYGFRYAKSSLLANLPRTIDGRCTSLDVKRSTSTSRSAERQTTAKLNNNQFGVLLKLLVFIDRHAFHTHNFQSQTHIQPTAGNGTTKKQLITCPNGTSTFRKLSQDFGIPLTGSVRFVNDTVVVSKHYTEWSGTMVDETASITWDLFSDVVEDSAARQGGPKSMILPSPVVPIPPKQTTPYPYEINPPAQESSPVN